MAALAAAAGWNNMAEQRGWRVWQRVAGSRQQQRVLVT